MPLVCQKFFVAALFDKAAMMQHQNSVAVSYRRKAVCDDQTGALTGEMLYRVLNDAFGL